MACRDGSTTKTTTMPPDSAVEPVSSSPHPSQATQAVDGFPEPPAAPHTPSTDVFHTLWNFAASTNRGLGGEYALQFGIPDLMEDPPAEAIYWENFNLAPTDLLGMSQDLDFSFDGTLQGICSDPAAARAVTEGDNLLEPTEPTVQCLPALSPAASPPSASSRTRLSNAVASGYKAYLRSPWLFMPVAQDHAYAESQALSVDERQLAQSPEVRQARQPPPSPVPRPMEAAARDAILAMAIQFSKATATIRSFPSCDLLNIFMQAFFVHEASRMDPWVHAATFHPDRCRTELLAAIVACGSTLFAAAKVWKMGLALQEVVKLAVRSAVDNDNRLTRDLQLSQAFLLWIEIALWSGHRRKMEIGEGFASSIITVQSLTQNTQPPPFSRVF